MDSLNQPGAATRGAVLVGQGTAWRSLPVGPDGQVLAADSTQHTGLAWTAPASLPAAAAAAAPSGSAATLDFSAHEGYRVPLDHAQNPVVLAFAGAAAGHLLTVALAQDGTGGCTVTWPAAADWGAAGAPTLSLDAGAIDIFRFYYDGTKFRGSVFGHGY